MSQKSNSSTRVAYIFLALLVFGLIAGAVAYPVQINISSNQAGFTTTTIVCGDPSCSSYTNSRQDIPTLTNSNGYSISGSGKVNYMELDYKACYLPHMYRLQMTDATTNGPYSVTRNFNQKSDCTSTVNTVQASNPSPFEKTTIQISTNVQGAVSFPKDANGNQFDFSMVSIPSDIKDFYDTKTKVVLKIKDSQGSVIYTSPEKEAYPLVNKSETVVFDYTPQIDGPFTAEIETQVTDCMCTSTQPITSSPVSFSVQDTDPVASFSFGTVIEGQDAQFTDTSTSNDGLTWEWNFGDGTALDTRQNPTHRFSKGGAHQVTLTVREADGDSNPKTQIVDVQNVNDNPIITATINPITLNEDFGTHEVVDLTTLESDEEDGPASDANNLRWSVVSVSDPSLIDVSIDVGSEKLSLVSKQDKFGTATVTLKLSDSQSGETTTSFNVQVNQQAETQGSTTTNTQVSADSVFTNSQGTNSNIQSSTVTGSTIIDSTVTNSNVQDSFIDPSTVSGSTIIRSRIVNSQVTNSNITDSNITNMQVSNAVVTNNVLQSGTIVYNGQTYTGSISLAEIQNTAPVSTQTVTQISWNEDSSDSSLNLNTQFSDPEGQTLSFSKTDPSNIQVSISANGQVTFTPDTNFNGQRSAQFTATDIFGKTVSISVTLNVISQNDQLSITTTAPTTGSQGLLYTYDIDASDIDGDQLTFTLQAGAPTGMTINPSTGLIQWTPTNNQVGNNQVTVLVSDGSTPIQQQFTISVSNANDAPSLSAISNQNIAEDSTLQFNVSADDPDLVYGDSLTYSINDSRFTITKISNTLATVSFSPTNSEVGTISVSVTVKDSQDLTITKTFSVLVSNTNDLPVLADVSNQNVLEDSTLQFNLTASDDDLIHGDSLTYTVNDSRFTVNKISNTLATVSFSPINSDVGTFSVQATVTDSSGQTSKKTFTVTVVNTNDAPTVTVLEPNGGELWNGIRQIKWTASDVDVGDILLVDIFTSVDGQVFQVLAENETNDGEFDWNTDQSSDSTNHKVRIEIKDGTTTVSDDSDSAFSLDNSVPNTVFASPNAGNYTSHQNITVTATDPNLQTISIYVNGLLASSSSTSPLVYLLTDGNHSVYAKANDTLGNSVQTETRNIFIDSVVPSVSFISPTPSTGLFANQNQTINITGTDNNLASVGITFVGEGSGGSGGGSGGSGASVGVSVNPGETTKTLSTTLSDGNYTYFGTARDILENNAQTETRTLFIDTINPTIQFENPTPANLATTNSNQIINVSGSDTNLVSIEIFVDGTLKNTCTSNLCSYSIDVSQLSDGPHTFNATIIDIVGSKTSTETRTLVVDKTAPSIQFVSPTPSDLSGVSGTKIINVTASDLSAFNIVIYIDGQNVTTCSSSLCSFEWNTTTFADGSHSINATSSDNVGNQNSTETRTFTIDNTAPSISLVSPANDTLSNSQTQNFIFAASDAIYTSVSCNLYINNNLSGSNSSVQSGVNTTITNTSVPEGTNTWYVQCADALGNTNTSEMRTLKTDYTSPQISSHSFSGLFPLTGVSDGGYFSPANTDGQFDSVSLTVNTSEEVIFGPQSIQIVNSSGQVVNSFDGPGETSRSILRTWFGNDSVGNILPDGEYTINITFTDLAGNTKTEILKNLEAVNDLFIIDNTPVNVILGNDRTVNEGALQTFDGSNSTDTGSEINTSSFVWNFGDSQSATGQTANHTYSQNGTYTVRLNVTDNVGNTGTNTIVVTVNDLAPTSSFTFSPSTGIFENTTTVQFNSTSTGYDTPLTYFWDFGDLSTSTQENPTHVFANNGTYTVNLTVTDADGSTNTSSQTLNILDNSPTANAGPDQTVNEGSIVFFDGSNSTSSPDSISSYFWDFGDGTNSTGQSVNHTYVNNNTYTVTLTVTDSDGSTNSDTLQVAVNDLGPTANFTWSPEPQDEDLPVQFNDTSTFVADNIVSWSWNFGDGSPINTTQNPTHVYGNQNTTRIFQVTLTIIDSDGSISSKSSNITINAVNDPPVVSTIPSIIFNEDSFNDSLVLSSFVSDVDNSVSEINWSSSPTQNLTISIDNTTKRLNVSAAPNWFGNETIVLTATDGQNQTQSNTITVIANSVNDAPVISTTAQTSATEDSLYSYDVNATDVESDTLLFTLESAPSGMTIDSSTGIISWTPNNTQVGSNNVSVQVSDGNSGIGEQNFTIVVANNAPIISNPGTQSATEDSQFSIDINSTDENEGLVFSLISPPSGMSINSTTGLISWTPTNTQVGTTTLNVSVDDAHGGTATTTFDINAGNNPTTITTNATTTATEDTLYTYDVNSTDEGQGDFFNLTTFPQGMTIDNSTGLISWTPLNNQVGSNNVEVEVDDGKGGSDTQAFSISVSNNPPLIATTALTSSTEDSLYEYDVNSTDEGQGLVYSLTTSPSGMTINQTTGMITWTPINSQVGINSVTVLANDTKSGTTTQSYSLIVSNNPPVFTSTAPTTATEDSEYLYDANSTDEGDGATFSLTTSPAGMTINSTTGLVNWTPLNNQVGSNSVVIRVNDGKGGQKSQSFSISVSNNPPTITSSAALNATEDSLYTYDVNSTDDGQGTITYSLALSPSGMTIDSSTGLISWTPLNNQVGTNNVSVQVSDGNSGVGEQNFTITVSNTNPTISSTASTTATENIQYTYDVNSTDDGQGTISYSLLSSVFGMSINQSTGLISWTPINTQVGPNNVSIQVSDGNGGTDTQNFTIVVANSNPTITSSPVVSVTEDSLYTYDVNSDEDGEGAISYLLLLLPSGMSINSTTGVITWTPTNEYVGPNNVSVQVSDGNGGVGEQNFTIVVANNPPIISDPGIQSATEDSLFTIDINSTDEGQGLLFYLESAPTGMTINETTGSVSWTPLNNQVGLNTVNVSVNDWQGGVSSLTFDINVLNNAPLITTNATISGVEDSLYTYDVNSTDEGQGATYNLTTFPQGMTIDNSTGLISWTPLNNQVGSNNVEVEVDDGNGGTNTQTFSISVSNTNDNPVLSTIPTQNTTEDVLYQFNVTASDDDLIHGDSLTYSVNDSRFSISKINNTLASLNFTPTNSDVGSFVVQVNVTDTQSVTDAKTFIVNVANVNDAPEFNSSTSLANVTFNEDGSTSLSLSQSFFDIDAGDSLTYSASAVDNISVSINQTTGVATLVPNQDFFGTRTVTFKATDSQGANSTDSNTVTITVNPVNDAPVLSASVTDVSFNEDGSNSSLDLSNFFTDVDNTTLVYTADPVANLTMNIVGSQVNISADPNFNGQRNVTFTASDGEYNVSDTVLVTVNPVNDAPTSTTIPDQNITEDTNFTFDISQYFSDVDADSLTFSIILNSTNISASINGSIVTLEPNSNFFGTNTIQFRASDSQLSVDSNTVTLNVSAVNDAPTVLVTQPNGGEIWNQNQNITWSASDVENDPLSVSIFASNDSGSTWNQIDTGLANSGLYIWNTTSIADGSYLINVTVSDGSLTTSDLSDGLVTVDNTAPDVNVALTGHNNLFIATLSNGPYDILNMTFTSSEPVIWKTPSGGNGINIYTSNGSLEKSFTSNSLSQTLFKQIDSSTFSGDDDIYTINVTTTDQAGNSQTQTVGNFTIDNTPPSVSISASSTTINEGESIFFNGSSTTDSSAGVDASSFVWNFGDSQSATGQTTNHTYSQNGTYTVRLNVTDNVGNTGTNTIVVTVNDLAPTSSFTFSPSTGIFENTTTVQFNSTSTGYDTPLTYFWDFGDLSTSTQENPTHVFANNGTYTVNLTVTDADGSTNTSSQTVSVSDTGPSVSISGTASTFVASTASYSASGSTGSDQPFTYEWDFNYTGSFDSEQNTGTTSSVDHTFSSTGTFTIAVRVTDSDGSQNISSMSTTVQPEQTHDIVVNSVTYNKADSTVYIGDQVTVSASVSNIGNFNESVTLRLFNGGTIDTETVSITKGETKTVNFTWTPSSESGGTILRVEALPVSGETQLGDNLATVQGSPIPVRSVVQNVNLTFVSATNFPKPSSSGSETQNPFFVWVKIENLNGFDLNDLVLTIGNETLTVNTNQDGSTSTTKTYDPLAAGQSTSFWWKLNAASGTHNITARIGNVGDRVEISRIVTV